MQSVLDNGHPFGVPADSSRHRRYDTALLETMSLVQKKLNPTLALEGLVLTMFDKRNKLSDLVASDVRAHFGDKVYETVIPRNVRVSEAPSHGRPVLIYDFGCAGSKAYLHLAGEVLRRERRALREERHGDVVRMLGAHASWDTLRR